jgi:hypothetical protein
VFDGPETFMMNLSQRRHFISTRGASNAFSMRIPRIEDARMTDILAMSYWCIYTNSGSNVKAPSRRRGGRSCGELADNVERSSQYLFRPSTACRCLET